MIILFTLPSFTFLSTLEKEKMVRKICKKFTHKRIFQRRKICQLTIPYFVLSKYYKIDMGHNDVWCSKKNTICLGNCICDMDASLWEIHKKLLTLQKHRFSKWYVYVSEIAGVLQLIFIHLSFIDNFHSLSWIPRAAMIKSIYVLE